MHRAPSVALRHTDGSVYLVPKGRAVLAPLAALGADWQGDMDEVGVLTMFHTTGVWGNVMVTRDAAADGLRVLTRAEQESVLAAGSLEAYNPCLLRERLLAPGEPEVLAALIELDATGATAMLEREVARRERERVASARGAHKAGSAFGVDSRRTSVCVRHAAVARALEVTLGAPALRFGETLPRDFPTDEAFERALAPARDAVARWGCKDTDYVLLHASVSKEACREQFIVEGGESHEHLTGRVSALLADLLAKAAPGGAADERVLLYSVSHARGEASLTASPRAGGAGGAGGHRDSVYVLVPTALYSRRSDCAKRLGQEGLGAMFHSAEKHQSRARLCVALARSTNCAPCATCHGSKRADPGAEPAVRREDLEALRAGGKEADAVAVRWAEPTVSKRVFEAFVCKCAHARTKRLLGKRASPEATEQGLS